MITDKGNNTNSRSSLACIPCRSKHVKCGGERPECSRCSAEGKICHYAKSRRGGLDRAALQERRKRLVSDQNVGVFQAIQPVSNQPISTISTAGGQIVQDSSPPFPRFNFNAREIEAQPYDDTTLNADIFQWGSSVLNAIADYDIHNDSLVISYYDNFHRFHPFALPRQHLGRICRGEEMQRTMDPLISAMRLIGCIYMTKKWSTQLHDRLTTSLCQTSPKNPYNVQGQLLYSIALFWFENETESQEQMQTAVRQALDMGMFSHEFAAEHGGPDRVLSESWRRTWWMIYIVDAYYAGTLGTMNFAVLEVEATAGLPCEETEYESGDIPEPRTLQDYDSRELNEDLSFSSFAHLIGACRCTSLAVSTTPQIATKEASPEVIHAADSIMEEWSLLLPEDRKQVMNKAGEIDELMFQAHLVIHVYVLAGSFPAPNPCPLFELLEVWQKLSIFHHHSAIVGLHRPFSDLAFNVLEGVSSCAREPPKEIPRTSLINVHTIRIVRSIEAQVRLLALPVRPFKHTPFTTCMVSEGTLALLSACTFLLKGKQLRTARSQIRMTIGCLRSLGQIWPRIARNIREIQTIARQAFGVPSKGETASGSPGSSDIRSGEGLFVGSENTTNSSEDGLSDNSILGVEYDWTGLLDLEFERMAEAGELAPMNEHIIS